MKKTKEIQDLQPLCWIDRGWPYTAENGGLSRWWFDDERFYQMCKIWLAFQGIREAWIIIDEEDGKYAWLIQGRYQRSYPDGSTSRPIKIEVHDGFFKPSYFTKEDYIQRFNHLPIFWGNDVFCMDVLQGRSEGYNLRIKKQIGEIKLVPHLIEFFKEAAANTDASLYVSGYGSAYIKKADGGILRYSDHPQQDINREFNCLPCDLFFY